MQSRAITAQLTVDQENAFDRLLSFERLEWEAGLLNRTESLLSESTLFNLHFDMIVNGGREALTKYHHGISAGRNEILEQVRHHLTRSDLSHLNEAISQFKEELKLELSKFIAEREAVRDIGATLNESDESMLSKAKSLWLAITENSSTIGILHLLLDIVGAFGDFVVPGVGVAADLINASIYVTRALLPGAPEGMWTMAIISVVAAMIPGGGDALKILKPGAKLAEPVISATARGGVSAGAAALGRVPAGRKPVVVRFLKYIAKYGSMAFSKLLSGLGSLSSSIIAKIGGWIPFIGGPIKGFFTRLGTSLSKFGDEVKSFSSRFDDVERAALKAELKLVDDALSKMYRKGGKIVPDEASDTCKIFDRNNTLLGEFPRSLVINLKNWEKRAPGLFRTADQAIAHQNFLANGARALLGNFVRGTVRLSRATLIFLGKQVYKYWSSGKDTDLSPPSDGELEATGALTLQDWVHERMEEQLEGTGAIYIPSVTMSANDREAYEQVNNYNNELAKKLGERSVVSVVRKEPDSEVMAEFNKFYDDIASGKIIQLEDGTFVRKEGDQKSEEEAADAQKTKEEVKDAPETEKETERTKDQDRSPRKFNVSAALRALKQNEESSSTLRYIVPYSKFS